GIVCKYVLFAWYFFSGSFFLRRIFLATFGIGLQRGLASLNPFENGISHFCGKQANSANSIVVARNDIIDRVGVAIGIDYGNDRNAELVGFLNSDLFILRVDDEHDAGEFAHRFDSAQSLLQFLPVAGKLQRFLFGVGADGAVLEHGVDLLETIDTLLDGGKVGQHAPQPALVDKMHAAAGSFFGDRILRLLFGADEQDRAAILGGIPDKAVGRFEVADGFLQIDDVDAVTSPEDVGFHLGVPAFCLVTEMDT